MECSQFWIYDAAFTTDFFLGISCYFISDDDLWIMVFNYKTN